MMLDISSLPDDSSQLKKIIANFKEFHDKKISVYEQENKLLREELRLLRARLYGRKTEKYSNSAYINKTLFDMPEPEEEPTEEIKVSAHTKKKPGRKPIPDDLPREEIIHDIPEKEKVCDCGARLVRIGEEVSEQLEIIPAKIKVIRHIRPKYACKSCEGFESECPSVKIAPPEPQIIPKSIATPGLLAYILVCKFVYGLPFYRVERYFSSMGIEISRSLMCQWAMKVALACEILLNFLKEELLEGPCINMDETVIQVLNEPERSPGTKSYMWLFARAGPERSILIYEYHPTRSGSVPHKFLGDYRGAVQTDGYQGYDFLDLKKEVRHIGCFAHVRRKFMDIKKSMGKGTKSSSADIALSYIHKLYRIERDIKDMSSSERYEVRQRESKPILESFKKWLDKRSNHVPPKSLLGKAIFYTLNQWPRLTGYIEDGMYSIDNNFAENAIRPFVIGRKNWLFAGTPEGARASASLYSLIETAKANGLEPYSYLKYIFEKLPHAKTLEEYEALLPWNCKDKVNPLKKTKRQTP